MTYILSIVVTVLLGLILCIYCVLGVGGYAWALLLTIACFAMNISSIIIFPKDDCLLALSYGITGEENFYKSVITTQP